MPVQYTLVSMQYVTKHYHPYISDDKTHDQVFVKKVLEEIIETVDVLPEICVIDSDNCGMQYKSAEHFEDMQDLSNQISTPIIRVYGIAGHGKGEVDHVGGLAKCSVRRYAGTGGLVLNANDCVAFLEDKFGMKSNPTFHLKEIDTEELKVRRELARQKKYPTINGSDNFQVMVFTPNSRTFKAAPYLCMCDLCKEKYGSCSLFKSYDLKTYDLKKIFLRSKVSTAPTPADDQDETDPTDDFLLPDTVCAVIPDETNNPNNESIWFIKVKDTCVALDAVTDDYGHTIPRGCEYVQGQFMEKIDFWTKGYICNLQTKKNTFFYKDIVAFRFVQFSRRKKGYFLAMEEYVDVLNVVEKLQEGSQIALSFMLCFVCFVVEVDITG